MTEWKHAPWISKSWAESPAGPAMMGSFPQKNHGKSGSRCFKIFHLRSCWKLSPQPCLQMSNMSDVNHAPSWTPWNPMTHALALAEIIWKLKMTPRIIFQSLFFSYLFPVFHGECCRETLSAPRDPGGPAPTWFFTGSYELVVSDGGNGDIMGISWGYHGDNMGIWSNSFNTWLDLPSKNWISPEIMGLFISPTTKVRCDWKWWISSLKMQL